MKIAFIGDLVLTDIEGADEFFSSFKSFLNSHESELIVNLESPISEDLSPKKEKLVLGAKKSNFAFIKNLDPLIINLSNNHIHDFGNQGIQLTKKTIEENGFQHVGVGLSNQNNYYHDLEKEQIRIYFLTHQTSELSGEILFGNDQDQGPYSSEKIILKKPHDKWKIIVSVHWGIEDEKYPRTLIRKHAYHLVDRGADIIIGHHPHIIQPIEKYEDSIIIYSLGNFYFDTVKMRNGNIKAPFHHQRKGLIAIVDSNKLEKLELYKFNREVDNSFSIENYKIEQNKLLNFYLHLIIEPLIVLVAEIKKLIFRFKRKYLK